MWIFRNINLNKEGMFFPLILLYLKMNTAIQSFEAQRYGN